MVVVLLPTARSGSYTEMLLLHAAAAAAISNTAPTFIP